MPDKKKIPVFRVTRPYLDLPVKPRIFQVFWTKYNFMHFERQFAFQNAGFFFSRIKKLTRKNMCAYPT